MSTNQPVGDADPRPRAALVDDSTVQRTAFQAMYPELNVIGTYASVEALLAAKPRVDVVALDLRLETALQGPKAIERLTAQGYRICVYTDERRILVLAQCFAAGAFGLARKSAPLAETQRVFIQVASGEQVPPSAMVELAELLERRDRLPELTTRQTEVLSRRARGVAWDTLARQLGISTKTAQEHYKALMAKMVRVIQDAGLDPDASAADIEHALGLAPGDLNDPNGR